MKVDSHVDKRLNQVVKTRRIRRVAPAQQALPLYRGTWGGKRPESGRRKIIGGRVPHLPRTEFAPRFPCLVTLKARPGIASLRTVAVVRGVESAFRRMRGREGFRLVHYSIQGNHLHALVEASDRDVLGRGMKALGIRFAKAVNRALRRKGPVVLDRYHARMLKAPAQVRNAIRYVLLNARRHAAQARGSRTLPGPVRLDPASSSPWFGGWRWRPRDEIAPPALAPPTSAPRTWLLSVGWKMRGLIDPSDVPGSLASAPG
jgi:REP element-mobilizing transposase RayT